MFVGRIEEIHALESALGQTRAGQPKNFMLTGERGIGKTSLLNWVQWVAQGEIARDDEYLNFLVVFVDIDGGTNSVTLVRKIERAFHRKLGETEKARDFLGKAWDFLRNVEAFGVKIHEGGVSGDTQTLLDEFAHSLPSTTSRICDPTESLTLFGSKYDGVLILIDEADNASEALSLGAFLKLLLERVQRDGCDNLMVGLAGLPGLREVLRTSHASSLRLFDEIVLSRLSGPEVGGVIDRCLKKANETNADQTTIEDEARGYLIRLSEGFPHFVQEFGYCAFETDSDNVIDTDDVAEGAFGERGAMVLIGDRYYRDDFYNRIQNDSYRQVLRIMADQLDGWISKQDIRSRFRGNDSTLTNALRALRDRNIIISREGTRGQYRLQHKGFALWIKFFTATPAEIQSQLKIPNTE